MRGSMVIRLRPCMIRTPPPLAAVPLVCWASNPALADSPLCFPGCSIVAHFRFEACHLSRDAAAYRFLYVPQCIVCAPFVFDHLCLLLSLARTPSLLSELTRSGVSKQNPPPSPGKVLPGSRYVIYGKHVVCSNVGVSTRSRDGAPLRKGCVVYGE